MTSKIKAQELVREISFGKKQSKLPRSNTNQISDHYKLHYFLFNILREQLERPINFWLLLLSVLQLSINFTEREFLFITLFPLLLNLMLSIIKEAFYRYSRYLADKKVNLSPCLVWNGSDFVEISTAEVRVGDLVQLNNKDRVPADLILLCTGTFDNKCLVDTSGILDEKNLMSKYTVKSIRFQLAFESLNEVKQKLKYLKGFATVPTPNADFSSFEGKIKLKVAPSASRLKMKNLILRDSKIMNTPWVIGLVAYVGNETKAWISSTSMTKKKSTLESFLNKLTLALCLTVIGFALFSLILTETSAHTQSFFNPGESFLHFLLIYSVLVPIPLYIALDIIRIIRVHKVQKATGVMFRNSGLIDDLGKVEYIIADKSGTLTDKELNISMILYKSSYYKNIEDLIDKDPQDTQLVEINENYEKEHFIRCLAVCNKGYTSDYGQTYDTKLADERVLINTATIMGQKLVKRDLKSLAVLVEGCEQYFTILGHQSISKDRKKGHILLQTRNKNQAFLYIIGSFDAMDAVVHFTELQDADTLEIIKSNKKSGIRQLLVAYKPISEREAQAFEIAYDKAKRSPVNKAGRIESLFEEIEENSKYLGVVGLEENVDIDTKISVMRFKHSGIKLWMLSGDSFESSLSAGLGSGIIDDTIPLISIHNIRSNDEFFQVSENIIDKYLSDKGSADRQLLHKLSLTVLNEPLSYLSSEKSLGSTPKDGRYYQNLSSIGPDFNTIRTHKATEEFGAVYSLRNSAQGSNPMQRRRNINPLVSKITNVKCYSMNSSKLKVKKNYSKYTLFIDSISLDFALKTEESLRNLVYLMYCADSVCFTSLLPSHKTKISKLLRDNFASQPVFVAIGDGGSDVGMLREARIGIGIEDNEGNQAASVSDIAVSEFSDLKHLILHQGLGAFRNIKKAIYFASYSTALLFSLMLMMSFNTDYSGAIFMPVEWYITFFLAFPVVTIVLIGYFKDTFTLQDAENNRTLYRAELLASNTLKNAIVYAALGAMQSLAAIIVYRFGFTSYNENALNESTLMFVSLLVSFNLTCAYLTMHITIYIFLAVAVSVGSAMIMLIIQSFTCTDLESCGALQMFSQCPIQVIHLFMLIIAQMIPVLALSCWQQLFWPQPFDYFRIGVIGKSLNKKAFKAYFSDLRKICKIKGDEFEKPVLQSDSYSIYTLKYHSSDQEYRYKQRTLPEKKVHFSAFSIWTMFLYMTILLTNIMKDYLNYFTLVYLSVTILLLILAYFIIKLPISDKIQILNLRIIYSVWNFMFFAACIAARKIPMSLLLFPVSFLLYLSEDFPVMIFDVLMTSGAVIYSAADFFLPGSDAAISIIQFTTIYICSTISCFIIAYFHKTESLKQNDLFQKLEEDYDKANAVLDYLLPAFVRKRVKDGVRYIAEDQGEVTVLFCYIVGFDKITSEYSVDELTSLLDELFGRIDSLCKMAGVTKIETVGNTYMASAGLKDSESELSKELREIPHARRAVELAFAILKAAHYIYLKNGERITLKIGINSGRVTAGVVGFHKPQFSLVGDTVNTASRMASSAEKNTIQISKETYSLIGTSYHFKCNKRNIEIKGKGLMETYTIMLNQLKSLDLHADNSASMSVSSMGATSFVENSSSSSEEVNNLLSGLLNFKSADLFKLGEGVEKVKFFFWCQQESEKGKEFKKTRRHNHFWITLSGLILDIINCSVMIITLYISGISSTYRLFLSIIELIFLFLLLLAIFFLCRYRYHSYTYLYITALYTLAFLISTIAYFNYPSSNIIAMQVLLHFQLISCCSGFFFSRLFLLQLILSLLWLIVLITIDLDNPHLNYFLPSSVYFFILQSYTMYIREKRLRVSYNLELATNKELETINKLLSQLIPPHVLKHLKEEHAVTDIFTQVTVVYADIVGFTSWSSGREAQEIVGMLSMLFTKFDESSVHNIVYKVHTIGDCYVAMGYRGAAERDCVEECENMIRFAYSMIEIIGEVRKKHPELNMRIGLHTGDVIGGVMGTSIVRYDIYGPDVLIANSMESNGIPGKVVISETTKQFLERAHGKSYSYRMHCEVKTLDRTVNAYELIKEDNDNIR